MSSQPYVYKPPTKRVVYNPPAKKQILLEKVNFEGLNVNKISELGTSSLFQDMDNLESKSNKTKIQQQIEKQTTPSITAPLGRKPIVRSVKQELKDESKEKHVLISRKPQIQHQNVQGEEEKTQKVQTSSFMYKPVIKRSSGQPESLNSVTISRNRSQILPKQTYKTQLKSQIIINASSTSKSITSLNKIEQPVITILNVETNRAQESVQKPYQIQHVKNIYNYKRPRTKTDLVRQIQTKVIQSQLTKQPISPIALSILNILVKKKLYSNIKHSFNQIHNKLQNNIKREKHLSSLLKKFLSLSDTYINNLQQECFNSLKRAFVVSLTAGQTSTSTSRITTKSIQKSNKQDEQINTIVEIMKKPLCYQLKSLLNSKLKFVLKQKFYHYYEQQTRSANKLVPISKSLFNILNSKTSNYLKNAFLKMKFTYCYIKKSNNEDLLTLFEMKNKKLTKQQILKYFQNILQNQTSPTSINRISLIQKTPQKFKKSKPVLSQIDRQKVHELKSTIQNLEKQIKEQQKLKNDKQDETNTKKVYLKREIEQMRKQNELRKKENKELKEKLKKFEVISFQDSKQVSNEFATQSKQVEIQQKDKPKRVEDEILQLLSSLYMNIILQKQQPSSKLSLQQFMNQYSNPLLISSINYLSPTQPTQTLPISDNIISLLSRSKLAIEHRQLIQQNAQLRWQIQYIQSKMIGEEIQIQLPIQVSEELNAMKQLIKNYIQQRYLWEAIVKVMKSM